MKCLVTGAAGFIGSHLCRRLLGEGYHVEGIDSFHDFYPKWIKEKNIKDLLQEEKFQFHEKDLNVIDLSSILRETNWVFHLAAQAGVRSSWGSQFYEYTKNNIEATQKILEAAVQHPQDRLIYASSSSVYGNCPEIPMSEKSPLSPFSPYGVTKLAGENLCSLYFKNYDVPCISLRFFTVYGPGQRPDMAFHKFFKSMLEDKEVYLYGDGKQTRDFTYITDIVEACFSCLNNSKKGEIYNIGGGNRQKLEDIFPVMEDICQKKIKIVQKNKQKGDVLHTYADIEKAEKDLNYSPEITVQEGLKKEWEWIQKLYFPQASY